MNHLNQYAIIDYASLSSHLCKILLLYDQVLTEDEKWILYDNAKLL